MILLVPIDLSPASDAVLREAESLGRALGAELVLLHVAPPDPDFVGYEAGPDSVRAQVAERFRSEHNLIQTRARELRERGLEARGLLVRGPPAETILKEAERLGVERIVMGSHGHGAVRTLLMGGTSKEVLRHTPLPVVVVPVRD